MVPKKNDGIIYIIPLDQRMSTPDFVVPSSPIPHRATLDLIPLFDGNKRPWHQKETEEMLQDTIELLPPSIQIQKKKTQLELCFSKSQSKEVETPVLGQKVELSEVICWFYGMKGSRLQTEHFLASLVDFSGCKSRLVALFCFQILFSRRPFSGEFCLPTLWVLRNYWPAVFLNQVPSLIHNKKH